MVLSIKKYQPLFFTCIRKHTLFFGCLLLLTSVQLTAQNISGVVNNYYKVLAIDVPTNRVKLNTVAGLGYDDRVMLIQMKGASINTGNNASFGDISAIGNAGLYEFTQICGLLNDTVVFRTNLINNYDASGYLQLVKIPQFTDVTVIDTLKAQPWDETNGTGGVLAIEASGTITLSSGVSASGSGFNGGTLYNFGGTCSNFFPASAYYYSLIADANGSGAYKGEGISATVSSRQCGKGKQANGGGGGNNHNSGGAGGSNYGSGGHGGNQTGLVCNGSNSGIGGVSLSSYGYSAANNRLFMGGGGGAGHQNNSQGVKGGNGGGIVYIKCNMLDAGGRTIEANGMQPFNQSNLPNIYEANGDGGGGGGAGGVIIIEAATITNNLSVEAKGGDGNKSGFLSQCTGPGGGGGGGVVWLSNASVPVNVTTNVAGGINGVVKVAACLNSANGATAGSNGTVIINYTKPFQSGISCTSLPLSPVINFSGRKDKHDIFLNWTYTNITALQQLVIQKSYGNNIFTDVKTINTPSRNNSFVNTEEIYPCYYRLMAVTDGGKKYFTSALRFTEENKNNITVTPNPVKDKLWVQLNGFKKQVLTIVITDAGGKMILQQKKYIANMVQTEMMTVNNLLPGLYFVRVYSDEDVAVAKFIRQ